MGISNDLCSSSICERKYCTSAAPAEIFFDLSKLIYVPILSFNECTDSSPFICVYSRPDSGELIGQCWSSGSSLDSSHLVSNLCRNKTQLIVSIEYQLISVDQRTSSIWMSVVRWVGNSEWKRLLISDEMGYSERWTRTNSQLFPSNLYTNPLTNSDIVMVV